MAEIRMTSRSRTSPWIARPRRIAGHLARLVLQSGARRDAVAEWRRRLGGEPALPTGPISSVLVICHGNICRSPFAARLLSDRHPTLEVRSGGLAAAEGDRAHQLARRVAALYDVTLDAHRSHRVTEKDLGSADLVLVMQGSQAQAVQALCDRASSRTRLLGDYQSAPPFLLTDPWGDDEALFVDSFSRIVRAVERLSVLLDEHTRDLVRLQARD